MYEYAFLFFFAGIWSLFASIQDLRSTEISDWLTFSLLIGALGYRGMFAVNSGRVEFFVFGLIGVVLFTGIAYAMYYGSFFAGGDAKLLMAFGAILPFENLKGYVSYGGGFIFLLLMVGVVYTLAFSFFLVSKNISGFKKSFGTNLKKWKISIYIGLALVVACGFVNLILAFIVLVVGGLLLYLKAVDDGCMIKLAKPSELREGDWLVADVRLGGKLIKKSVHGLTEEEIAFIRKHHKSVMIRNGIPFAPCFLFALIAFMVFFFSKLSSYSVLF